SSSVDRHAGGRPPRHRRTPGRPVPGCPQSLPAGGCHAMTEAQLTETIRKVLGRIAPEADLSTLGPNENIRATLDIDSFDHLNFLIGLHEALGVEIPEADYGQLTTLADIIRYVSDRLR